MILVNIYAIRPLIPKTVFVKHCRIEIVALPFVLFHRDRFFNFYRLFPSAILVCISAQTLPPATTCSCYSLYQVWQTWAYSLVFVQLACWRTDISRWSGRQPWRLSPFHRIKHCWCAIRLFRQIFSARTALFSGPLAQSAAYIWLLFDFASHLATGTILAIAIISRLFCLQGTHGSFKH